MNPTVYRFLLLVSNVASLILTATLVVLASTHESRQRRALRATPSSCPCDTASSSPVMDVPKGNSLLYEQNFDVNPRLAEFEFTDPAAWRIGAAGEGGGAALELFAMSDYRPRVRSPYNIAMLKVNQFSDFILEADIQQNTRNYNHRDFCLFFGIRDASNFYYVHMGAKADATSNNIFLVNDEDRVAIANYTTTGVDWGTEFGGDWQQIRLERRGGEIYVHFNQVLILQAYDTHFPSGYLGFGSFDDTGFVDNVKVWGPGTVPARYGFFA